ncbi:hypothetical protein A7U60_g2274 [Sanghuangporus baumii]|uniref:DUF6533 domain-containing protein n=1 Tax=Sanghuangporus baumii TaxID=108892 RepID=A0A9Q5NAQ2_SANBA|nr:hypothetical protein A7U60_g2274 [Sanghuangporus baumii]
MASSAPMPTIGSVVEGFVEFVQIVQLVKLFSLSSMVLYIYNYFLTLDSEVSVMWRAGQGIGKTLYFVLRYCTLFSTVCMCTLLLDSYHYRTLTTCTGSARNIFYWVSAVVIALATDSMIASFATFLTIILRGDEGQYIFVTVHAIIYLLNSFLPYSEKMTYLGPGADMYICEGSTLPPVYDKIWVAKLANEALMFLLALHKGIQSLKQYKGMGAASQLMVLLVKDSILYFLVVFAFCLMSQLVWTYAGQHYVELSIGLTLAVGSIMSQHLLVNVRMQVTDKALSATGSDMRYGRPSAYDFSTNSEEDADSTILGTFSDEV